MICHSSWITKQIQNSLRVTGPPIPLHSDHGSSQGQCFGRLWIGESNPLLTSANASSQVSPLRPRTRLCITGRRAAGRRRFGAVASLIARSSLSQTRRHRLLGHRRRRYLGRLVGSLNHSRLPALAFRHDTVATPRAHDVGPWREKRAAVHPSVQPPANVGVRGGCSAASVLDLGPRS